MSKQDRYTDWLPILKDIPNINDKVILELGCGSGTKYLVDNFKYVYSYETNSRDVDGTWFTLTSSQNKSTNKWDGMFTTSFKTEKSHITDLNGLYNEVNEFVNFYKDIDVVFVDPGFAQRAECVLYFMKHEIEYIFTHDTNTEPELYNWKLLNTTPGYSLVGEIKTGQGVKLYKRNA
jgi:hypothetical protein